MALVHGRYYQHTVRINGRFTLQYYGKGEEARRLAADHALIRASLERERREAREWDDQQQEAYAAEQGYGTIMRGLVEIALTASGYHRPQRRRWMRRRMAKQTLPVPTRDAAAVKAEMQALVRRVADRDDAAVVPLSELAAAYPTVAVGAIRSELPRHARRLFARALLDLEGRDSRDAQEGLIARMALIEHELTAGSPSPGLRLAAQAAAYEWGLFWSLAVLTCSRDRILDEHPRLTMRRTAAAKRFAYMLKTVEQIRALSRPTLVATQINVGTGPASPP
jgi:hypothetical protein